MPLMTLPAGGHKQLIPVECLTDGSEYTGTCSDTLDGDEETYISVHVGSGVGKGQWIVWLDLGSMRTITKLKIRAKYTKGADATRNGRINAIVDGSTIASWSFTSTVDWAEYTADVSVSAQYLIFESDYYNECSGGCDAGTLSLAEIVIMGR